MADEKWNQQSIMILKRHYKLCNCRLVDGETGRRPGSISGQQFQIKNCNNSHIYLFDWSNTVTVDDCINCKIFIGPVKVFPRIFCQLHPLSFVKGSVRQTLSSSYVLSQGFCPHLMSFLKGSVFIRDCTNCVVVVACGQFRTRDCRCFEPFDKSQSLSAMISFCLLF